MFRAQVPVHENQVVSQQGTLGLGPENLHQTAGVQTLVHVQSVCELVHCLQGGGGTKQAFLKSTPAGPPRLQDGR